MGLQVLFQCSQAEWLANLQSSRVELRGDFQELNGRIDRLYQLLAPARQPDLQT